MHVNNVYVSDCSLSSYWPENVVNPRRACTARVTVLGLCVCVSVCVCLLLNISLLTCLFMPQTILTFLAADEGSKILSDFL